MKACSVEGCEGESRARGYCGKHYQRLKKNGDPLKVFVNQEHDEKCSIEGCEDKYYSKNYCNKHYKRHMIYGSPLGGGPLLNTKNDGKCSVDGCGGKYHGKGYCAKHYDRVWRQGDPLKSLKNRDHNGKCSIEGCDGKYYGKGLCAKHWTSSDFSRAHAHKRRSWKLNAIINDLTAGDWSTSLKHFNNECAYCGCKNKKFHADHVVPLARGGSNTITNIIPSCVSCNKRKSTTSIEKWYPNQNFYSKQRENKIYKWIGYKAHKDALQATLF